MLRSLLIYTLALLLAGCGKHEAPSPAPLSPVVTPAPQPAETRIREIAQAIAVDMGAVTTVKTAGVGAPVLIFEEIHNIARGQLEESVMLARAHDQFGLKNVVLEGFYEGAIEGAAQRIRDEAKKRPGVEIEEMAAALVADGELSSVEFLALGLSRCACYEGGKVGDGSTFARASI
jgi:hypothetical protein